MLSGCRDTVEERRRGEGEGQEPESWPPAQRQLDELGASLQRPRLHLRARRESSAARSDAAASPHANPSLLTAADALDDSTPCLATGARSTWSRRAGARASRRAPSGPGRTSGQAQLVRRDPQAPRIRRSAAHDSAAAGPLLRPKTTTAHPETPQDAHGQQAEVRRLAWLAFALPLDADDRPPGRFASARRQAAPSPLRRPGSPSPPPHPPALPSALTMGTGQDILAAPLSAVPFPLPEDAPVAPKRTTSQDVLLVVRPSSRAPPAWPRR